MPLKKKSIKAKKKKSMVDNRKFKIGKPILEVKNISLSFGGVKAITNISFNIPRSINNCKWIS